MAKVIAENGSASAEGRTSVIASPPSVTNTLTVASTNPSSGVPITVSPSDNNGQSNDNTQFTRTYNNSVVVSLGAAASAGGNNFSSWTGCDSVAGTTCTVTMNADRTVTANYGGGSGQPALRFIPLAPCRIADTRNATGPIDGHTSRDFVIPDSSCGVPATAAAYSLNVTVVPHGGLGYLTVWPSGQSQPLVSTLNSLDGRIKANAAIVPAGTGGAISIYVTDTTDVILDINGYFVPATSNPSALAFFAVPPCRVADTRDSSFPPLLGPPSLIARQARSFPVLSSSCNIPSVAQAYSLNFTVVPPGPLGFLTIWPTGMDRPLVSTLNAPTGTVTANAAIVPAGINGAISAYVTDNTDLVIDINGYFAPSTLGTDLSLYTLPPCRVLDTRETPIGSLPDTISVDTTDSPCRVIPSGQAVVLNATVVPPQPLGFLTLWPSGQARPLVSTLNALDGQITSNMAIVPTSSGVIDAYATNPTQLILDTSGYFASGTAPAPITYLLTVARSGSGSGTITSLDNKINCGALCTVSYVNGTVVMLTASAASGSSFAGWSGCDSTSGTACTVTMNADRTVTANYIPPRTLMVASTNPSSGVAIAVSPLDNNGQGNGTTQFTRTYTNGATVTLGAPPTFGGNNFSSWTGCDSTSGIACTVTMNASRTVTANYLKPAQAPHCVYVANQGTGTNNTISAYTVGATGALASLPDSITQMGPTSLAVDPKGQFLYVPSFTVLVDPITLVAAGPISVYAIGNSCQLTEIAGSPFLVSSGQVPLSVAIASDTTGRGQFAYASNFSDGGLSGYTLNPSTGVLTKIQQATFPTGQVPTGVAVDPNNKFVYSANFLSNNISGLTINPMSGTLTPIVGSPFAAGSSPISIVMHPTRNFAYVANESSSNISGYTIGHTGVLTELACSPFGGGTLPFSLVAPFSNSPIAVHPTGKFVYAATTQGIFILSVDTSAGPTAGCLTLQSVPVAPAAFPSTITIEATGSFAYVTDSVASSMSSYSIDQSTGGLTPIPSSATQTGPGPIYVITTPFQAPAASFTWPVDPNNSSNGFYDACADWPGDPQGCYWLTSGGWRDVQPFQKHLYSGYGYHLGADWNLGSGSDDANLPVYAIASGTVSSVQPNVSGWGNLIFVIHNTSSGTYTSMYAHVNWTDSGPPTVGDTAARGQQIAKIGNGNGLYPYHLHLEVRVGNSTSAGTGYTDSQVTSGPQGQIDPDLFIATHR